MNKDYKMETYRRILDGDLSYNNKIQKSVKNVAKKYNLGDATTDLKLVDNKFRTVVKIDKYGEFIYDISVNDTASFFYNDSMKELCDDRKQEICDIIDDILIEEE